MRLTGLFGAAVLVVAYLAGPAHAANTKTVSVDCGSGESIGAALAQNSAPGRMLTVNIKGTCSEHVVVTADDTTLRGDPSGGASVNGSDPNRNTILVDGAARCVIENLLVTGARNGIVGTNSASVTVVNVQAQSNAQSGIGSFAGSRVNVNGSVASNNGGSGIFVSDTAAGFVTNSTVQNNGSNGVIVQRAGSARIGQDGFGVNGPNTISNNGGNGVFVYESAQALVHGNTVNNNGGAGVSVEMASATITGNTIQSNTRYGISVTNNAGARIGITDQTTPAGNAIMSNTLDGVNVSNGANANLFGNAIGNNGRDGINISRASGRLVGNNVISSNVGRGVSVSGGTLFQAQGDFGLTPTLDTVMDNTGDGVGVFQGASAELQDASITGNGGRGINLSNSGSLRILGSTISGNAGDGIGVFNGSSALLLAPTVNITGNAGNGINLFDGASADIQFASITSNGGRGVTASTGAKLRLLGTTVSLHPNDGVGLFDGSTVLIQCTFAPFPTCAPGSINTISGNNFHGVNVATGSTGVLQGVTVSGTAGLGVRADTNATLRLQTNSTVITGNTTGGISASHHAILNFNSPPISVNSNGGGFQVNCAGAPSTLIGNVSGVAGGVSPTCGTVF
jgi:parallel beta-helix repeat protein